MSLEDLFPQGMPHTAVKGLLVYLCLFSYLKSGGCVLGPQGRGHSSGPQEVFAEQFRLRLQAVGQDPRPHLP